MAKALMANGAKKIYILGRRIEVLDAAAKETSGLVPVQCDVTSKDSLQAAVDKITADTGYINLLIANSGLIGNRNVWGAGKSIQELRKTLFTEHSMEDFTETLRVSGTGAFFTMTAFLELLDAGNRSAGRVGGHAGGRGAGRPKPDPDYEQNCDIEPGSRNRATIQPYGGAVR